MSRGEDRALLFDFDGLVLDTESSLLAAWQAEFDLLGLPLDRHRYVAASFRDHSDTILERVEELAGALSAARAGELVERIRLRHFATASALPAMPGVRDLLAGARAAGVRTALTTSSSRAWVSPHLERLGLPGLFDVAVYREDVAASKPAPDAYRLTLHLLGVPPTGAVALEDSPRGVRSATAAGVRCVAVPGPVTRLLDFGAADLRLEGLSGVDLDMLFGPAAVAR
ncbi:HAD family hydrolase [Longispora urticae]